MKPNVTVIMPVYNGVKYLRESIGSVIAQTVPPLEMFIVDDGSSDGSAELAASIDTPFPKYILHQPNKRQSAARNLAAGQAKGKYLAFLDHDDIWYPRHIEKLIPPMEDDVRMGWTYSDIDEMDADGGMVTMNVLHLLNPHVQHPKTTIFNMLGADMFIFPSAAVVRTEAFHAIGGFDERLSGYEDDDLFLRLFRAGWMNHYSPESLVRYRRHPDSSAFSERMWISRDIYAGKLLQDYPDDPVLVRFYVRDIIAPRFFAAARAEYLRHFPHGRWEQCRMSLALMKRFAALERRNLGRTRLRRAIAFALMENPKFFAAIYPYVRALARLPRLV